MSTAPAAVTPGLAVLPVVLVVLLVPATIIDLERRVIPNRITGPGAVLAVVLGLLLDPAHEPGRLIGGAAAGGFLLLALVARPSGMGMGDVKLAGMLGLFLGPAVAVALLVALVAGAIAGVAIIAVRGFGDGHRTAVAFGPFLALGAVVAMLVGGPVIHWYLGGLR